MGRSKKLITLFFPSNKTYVFTRRKTFNVYTRYGVFYNRELDISTNVIQLPSLNLTFDRFNFIILYVYILFFIRDLIKRYFTVVFWIASRGEKNHRYFVNWILRITNIYKNCNFSIPTLINSERILLEICFFIGMRYFLIWWKMCMIYVVLI